MKPLFNAKRKVAGMLSDDEKVFCKVIDSKKHLVLKLGEAVGMDEYVFNQLSKKGTEVVKLVMDKTKNYFIPFEKWVKNGVVRDLGYGKQVFLARQYWEQKQDHTLAMF